MSTHAYNIEPIAVPIPKASQISGMSRSAIYRELGAGRLRAVKQGSRTLVMVDSIRGYLAGCRRRGSEGKVSWWRVIRTR